MASFRIHALRLHIFGATLTVSTSNRGTELNQTVIHRSVWFNQVHGSGKGQTVANGSIHGLAPNRTEP